MSYLTTPAGTLQVQVIAALEGQGFAYNPLRTTFAQYLATALGEPTAYLHKSIAQMLSEIDAQYGGSLSHLRSSVAQLMDDVAANTGAGGGGGGYVAKAVHFDLAANHLHTDSLTATDSSLVSFSVWVNDLSSPWTTSVSYPMVDGANTAVGPFITGGGVIDGALSYSWADQAYENYIYGRSATEVFTHGVWHNLMGAVDTNHPAGSRIILQYCDDVPIDVNAVDSADVGLAFMSAFNGMTVDIPDKDYGEGEFDVADLWFAPGQFVDFSIEANRRKFISESGKPVDLGADGSLPTGTAPAIFFSGDETGFATNKGTGGAFSLTGSLTNASTSPSD